MAATTATTRGWVCWLFLPVPWLCGTGVVARCTVGATTGPVGAPELVAGTKGVEEWCVTTTLLPIAMVGAGVIVGVGVAAGVAAGDGAGVMGVGVCAGGEVVGFGGATRRRTATGFECPSTCWRETAAAAWTRSTGADGTLMAACGTCSGRARTIAGAAAPWGTAIGDVWLPPGPARKRGNAAAPATAPARRTAAMTPFVIPLMVPTSSAEYLTRKGYRQVGTRA